MTATQSEALAAIERNLEVDPKAAADVLLQRVRELAAYHAPVLKIARPLIRELIVGYAAMLQNATEDATFDLGTLLGAVAMALDEPQLTTTLRARIARARTTVAAEALRQANAPEPIATAPMEGHA